MTRRPAAPGSDRPDPNGPDGAARLPWTPPAVEDLPPLTELTLVTSPVDTPGDTIKPPTPGDSIQPPGGGGGGGPTTVF